MSSAEEVDRRWYPALGRCIYCSSTDDLTDEHTIPYGLGGTLVLPKASCKTCADITRRFEQNVLRGPMQQVRVFRRIQSRTKHKDAPTTKQIEVTRKDGAKELADFGFTEARVVYSFPIFDVPGYVKPEGYTAGIRLTGVAMYGFGPSPAEVARSQNAVDLSWQESHLYNSFAKMIAKIAYATAVGQAIEAGIARPFEGTPYVVPGILGRADDIGRWVGTLTTPFQRYENHLHRVTFGTINDGRVVLAEVQLFADSGTPSYGVILGETSVK
jgi:hypothetical protein